MRKKKKFRPLASTRRLAAIPRDLYHQTTGMFGIGITLVMLAVAIPVAVYAHHQRSPGAAAEANPSSGKGHVPVNMSKTVV